MSEGIEVVNENSTIQTNTNNVQSNQGSYFDGGLLQLIGWKLLGGLLTLVTLGLAYPFALCMIYKWETKHTVINGRRLKFDGTGTQLWGKWIVWTLLTIVTLGIYSFWLTIKSNQWMIKHTHYEDTTVDEQNNTSEFDGGLLQYLGWSILGMLITLCTLGLLTPVYICFMYKWRINHTIVDGDRFNFDGNGLQLWGLWIKWILLSIITLGIYSFWTTISLLKWEKKHTSVASN